MKQFKMMIMIGSAALMAACASTSDYRAASSASASGYSEIPIESDRYQVSYHLNRDDLVEAQELALRRAAELTLERGYDTFELVSQATDADTERDRFVRGSGSDTIVQRNCGLLGCSTSLARVPADPFHSDIERERSEVTVTLEIIMSDKDASVSPSLYDASEVFANLTR